MALQIPSNYSLKMFKVLHFQSQAYLQVLNFVLVVITTTNPKMTQYLARNYQYYLVLVVNIHLLKPYQDADSYQTEYFHSTSNQHLFEGHLLQVGTLH